MSELAIAVAGSAWVLEAVALGFLMGRRGYEGGVWLLGGVLLGPVAVVFALTLLVRPPAHEPRLLRSGKRRAGRIDVLVGIDGSPESTAAVGRALDLFDSTAGRVTLARVIPIDASVDAERDAESDLAAACAAHPELDPSTVLLRGEPAGALRDYVRRLGYEVLVVGTRGEGRSHAALGSVALALARGVGITVLLVDDAPKPPRDDASDHLVAHR